MSEKKAAARTEELDVMLNEAKAAEFLGYSRSRLNSWRIEGKGPKFVKLDTRAVRYKMSDLHEWLKEHSVTAQSTAESKVG